jgi:hypothetical protein
MTSNGIQEGSPGIPNPNDPASPIMKEKYPSSAASEDISTIERISQDDNSDGGEFVSGKRFINTNDPFPLDPSAPVEDTNDPFPLDPSAPVEERQLTVRALFVGCLLGAVISASNVYLGLKVCEFLSGNFEF